VWCYWEFGSTGRVYVCITDTHFGRHAPHLTVFRPQVARDAMAEWQVERTQLAVEHSCARDWSGPLETLMADTGALIESAMTISDADAATLARVCA